MNSNNYIISQLRNYLQLKYKINQLSDELKEQEDLAIGCALDIIGDGTCKNQIAYTGPEGKIVVVFKNKHPKIQEHASLERIEADIQNENIRLMQIHQQRIDEINEEIDQLMEKIAALKNEEQNLLFSPYLGRLKNEFKNTFDNLIEKVPSLSVYLNKLGK